MLNKKKIVAVAASVVVVAPMVLTNPVFAAPLGIISKIENQLTISRIMADIERLSMENGENKDNARVTGFEGEHKAADYILSQFTQLGLQTELRKIDNIDGFIDDGSTVVIDNQSIEVKTMTYSQPTNGILEGELAYAGLGTAQECENANLNGKIAIIKRGTISFSDKAKNAYEHGAKAVIIYNNTEGTLNGTLGSFETSKVPTVGMNKADGEKLVAKLNNGETVNASATVNTLVAPDSYSYNVIGRIPAHKNVQNPKTIVIGAHFDGVSCPGANDNASGTATIIEAARLLSKTEVKNKLQYNIEFVAFGAEEIGLVGSKEYVQQLKDSNQLENVVGMINLDMVGVGEHIVTYNSTSKPSDFMTEISHKAIDKLGYEFGGHYTSGSSDHAPFEAAGVPAVFLQFSKDPYYHTDEDSYDKINPENIRQTAMVVLNMAMDMQEKHIDKNVKKNNLNIKNMQFENDQMPSK